MWTRWELHHDGRRIEVVPADGGWANRLVLRVDDEVAADERARDTRMTLTGAGITVRAKLAWHGLSIQRAELVPAHGDPITLAPEAGSRAARRERFARRHPGIYAARHVAAAIGKLLIPLIGIGVLLRFLPDIPLPSIDLPSVPLPDIPWPDLPDIPWPSIELPGWVKAIGEAAKYWGPILGAVLLATREYQRRRRQGPPPPDDADPSTTRHEGAG